MFDRLYQRAMRRGSKLLFALALILPILLLIEAISEVGRLGPQNDLHPNWLGIAMQLVSAASAATIPLFGALIVDRFDRYLALREAEPPSG